MQDAGCLGIQTLVDQLPAQELDLPIPEGGNQAGQAVQFHSGMIELPPELGPVRQRAEEDPANARCLGERSEKIGPQQGRNLLSVR
jgi:hypothetical protein